MPLAALSPGSWPLPSGLRSKVLDRPEQTKCADVGRIPLVCKLSESSLFQSEVVKSSVALVGVPPETGPGHKGCVRKEKS